MKDGGLSAFRGLEIANLIADKPAQPRDSSRLMIIDRKTGDILHRFFRDLPDFFQSGDCLVINDSKVWKARIYATKDTGARTEFLLAQSVSPDLSLWNIICRKTKPGASYTLDGGIKAQCLSRNHDGSWLFSVSSPLTKDYLKKNAVMPLPGYIEKKRKAKGDIPRPAGDEKSYQTVYAKREGSIAAPTAGFHFTSELLEKLEAKGVKIARVTLHIGWGTFKPIRGHLEEHKMLPEFCSVDEVAAETVNIARKFGRSVTAVGTSSVRTLETLSDERGTLRAGSAKADIFIYPGYRFKVPDRFITNLHVPDSPPLAMTTAFCGSELLLKAYRQAVEFKYRFYSYGDSSLII